LYEKGLIDATITLKDTWLEIAGRINSEKVREFLNSNIGKEFPGWIKFNITVSSGEGSRLSLNQNGHPLIDQNGHPLTWYGKVGNFDLKGMHTRLKNKQEGAISIATSALHKLAGEDPSSTVLDRLSDIIAEEIKRVGHATEIKPGVHLQKLLRILRSVS